jgi:hypothetical protein
MMSVQLVAGQEGNLSVRVVPGLRVAVPDQEADLVEIEVAPEMYSEVEEVAKEVVAKEVVIEEFKEIDPLQLEVAIEAMKVYVAQDTMMRILTTDHLLREDLMTTVEEDNVSTMQMILITHLAADLVHSNSSPEEIWAMVVNKSKDLEMIKTTMRDLLLAEISQLREILLDNNMMTLIHAVEEVAVVAREPEVAPLEVVSVEATEMAIAVATEAVIAMMMIDTDQITK